MWYFFPGLIAGALAALFLFSPSPAVEIYPEWWGGIKNLKAMEKSPVIRSKASFFVKAGEQDYYLIRGNGDISLTGSATDGMTAFSGNGLFYVKYQKVGNDIEFYNARGDRFWKIESMEYPYLSHGGKIVLLMNGDQSGIRIVDYNGNLSNIRISGRTCTSIAFSDRADFSGVGFLDGSYYFIDARGKIMRYGMTPKGTMVKGLAVSGNGSYGAVHYGDSRKDTVRIIEIGSGDSDEVDLAHAHPVKTSLYVNGDGYCTIIDTDRVLNVSSSGSVKLNIAIPPKREGHSSISYFNGVYAASYTMQTGASKLLLFREDGVMLFSREFPAESFLDSSMKDGLLFLRGSDNVFCYSLHGI
jgi:hypothetical protein